MTSRPEERINEPKNHRNKRLLLITGVLAAILFATAAIFFVFGGFHNENKQATGLSSHKKINILLLGIDERRNDIGRSNVTCVVSIDPDTKNVSMLWVPRDSRVKIPGHGWNKIGHAYAYDGPKLSKQTVSDLLGIPIDYYMSINMDGFNKVIDALGGVNINVEKRMYYYDPYDEGEAATNNGLIDLKPGMQHMDGSTALAYVRFRHDELGDIGRIERQQKFAKALLTNVINPAVITKIPSVIKEANSMINTDMPPTEMLRLAKAVTDAYKQGLKTEMVPGKPVYIDEISYWLPNIIEMRKQVAQIQGIASGDKYLAAARNLAAEYEAAIPPPIITDDPPNSDKQSTTTNKTSTTNSTPKKDAANINEQSSATAANGQNTTTLKVPQTNSNGAVPESGNGSIRKVPESNTNSKSHN